MLPECFPFSLLFLLLPFQISPRGLIKYLWWLGAQGGGKGLPVGWPLMIPTGWQVKEGCGTGEKHPKLDPDAGPWCLLDSGAPAQLCFHICDFPPSPSESKHSSCSWHISTSRERKEPPLGISYLFLQLPQSQAGFLSPVFDTQLVPAGGHSTPPCQGQLETPLPTSLILHTCRASPEFQGEHSASLSTAGSRSAAGTRGCVIKLSLPRHEGRAQPCPAPAG